MFAAGNDMLWADMTLSLTLRNADACLTWSEQMQHTPDSKQAKIE